MTEAATAPAPAADSASATAAPDTATPVATVENDAAEALSTEDAVRKAMGLEKKELPKATAQRDEAGKFKGKDEAKPEAKSDDKPEAKAPKDDAEPVKLEAPKTEPKTPAPERFNAVAKAAWEKADPAIQAETARGFAELEKGLKEYQDREAPLKEYRALAEKNGLTLEGALRNYVEAEKALTGPNPERAIAQLANQYMPGGLEGFLNKLMGNQTQEAPEVAQMRQQLAEQSKQIEALTTASKETAQQQAIREREMAVSSFSAANPRAAEPAVEAEMVRLLQSGYVPADLGITERLSQAYEVATRLIPAADPEPAPPAPMPQTQPEPTSLSGAPSGGSDPRDDAPLTTDEAIRKALRLR